MDNLTTGTKKKSSIHDQLLIMSGIVDSLTEANVRIIIAEATVNRQPYILTSLHDLEQYDNLRRWAAENELDIIVEELEKDEKTRLDYEWWTEVNGIRVTGYMTESEKEAWDHADLGDEPGAGGAAGTGGPGDRGADL